MAEIKEIKDVEMPLATEKNKGKKKGFKNLNKKQKFLVLCVIVALIGLFVFYRKKTGYNSVVASGYDGYPVMSSVGDEGGGSGYDETDINGLLAEQEQYYNDQLNAVGGQYEETISGMEKQYAAQIDSMATQYEADISRLQENLTYKDTVAQMLKNSNDWWYTNDPSARAALSDENKLLGESIGATFDSKTGTWLAADGSRLFVNSHEAAAQDVKSSVKTYDAGKDYQSVINGLLAGGAKRDSEEVVNNVINRAAKISGENMSVTYDKNVDYQAAINRAKETGASQSVIDTLTAQRNAKIKGENLNADGTKKTSSGGSSSGRSSSGGSKNSSSGGKTVKVQSNGKAPSGLSVGTNVVTGGGTYKITGVNKDGSYKSVKVSNTSTHSNKGSNTSRNRSKSKRG